MGQLVEDDRKLVGAHVDREVREQLLALARREDRSVASIVRRALSREIEREHTDEEEA
jgi:predicted transcriptional regulator